MIRAGDLEDVLYKILKRDREFNDPRWPFVIEVRDVQGKFLVDATFKHRNKEHNAEFDAVIQAKRDVLRFDSERKIVRVLLKECEAQRFRRDADIVLINDDTLDIPIPAADGVRYASSGRSRGPWAK